MAKVATVRRVAISSFLLSAALNRSGHLSGLCYSWYITSEAIENQRLTLLVGRFAQAARLRNAIYLGPIPNCSAIMMPACCVDPLTEGCGGNASPSGACVPVPVPGARCQLAPPQVPVSNYISVQCWLSFIISNNTAEVGTGRWTHMLFACFRRAPPAVPPRAGAIRP
jgi:hypothetical protein